MILILIYKEPSTSTFNSVNFNFDDELDLQMDEFVDDFMDEFEMNE